MLVPEGEKLAAGSLLQSLLTQHPQAECWLGRTKLLAWSVMEAKLTSRSLERSFYQTLNRTDRFTMIQGQNGDVLWCIMMYWQFVDSQAGPCRQNLCQCVVLGAHCCRWFERSKKPSQGRGHHIARKPAQWHGDTMPAIYRALRARKKCEEW